MTDAATTTAKVSTDTDRIDRIVTALHESELDAVFCSVPCHVLMLTGYWPVMGNTVALFTADGSMHLLLPEDEEEIAVQMSVAERISFQPGSLSKITNSVEAIAEPLTHLVASLGLDSARIGVELQGQCLRPPTWHSFTMVMRCATSCRMPFHRSRWCLCTICWIG